MRYLSLDEFKDKTDEVFYNALVDEEMATITTENGRVVVLTEHQYECILEAMVKCKKKY